MRDVRGIKLKRLFLFLVLRKPLRKADGNPGRCGDTSARTSLLSSKKIQLTTLVSLQHTAVTANLTLVVPCHQRICLNRILTDIRKGTKLLHEHVEHWIVMTPVVLTQPEPLEMILLFQCHQMLPQLVNLHALLHCSSANATRDAASTFNSTS